jgi:hypothetical protein
LNRKENKNMTEIAFNKLIEVLDQEMKWAFETRAYAESQQALNYWSGYYAGLQKALELLLKVRHFKAADKS